MNWNNFKDPAPLYRNAPFWSMNDRLDKDELFRQMDEMSDKGWGSYFMHSRVGLITGYLSDEWFELTKDCAEYAKQQSSYLWLYDEDKWPSGFAGGLVSEKNPAYRNMHLILLEKGNVTKDDTILKVYKRDGNPLYICKRLAPLGDTKFNGASYVDLMNSAAVEEFLQSTHEKYKETCGEYFGKEIPGVFTDEPCYLMKSQYPEPTVPWSECLTEFFETSKGYSILDHLEQLFFEVGDYQKIRFDFYDSATRLFLQSFTKQYYEWCDDNNLKLTGHFMAEDSHLRQTNWIVAAMPHYEFMHWPGVDKLQKNIAQLVTMKQLTSVTDQLGKEKALCEVFGCIGQQSNFFHRKWITDWQAILGISFVNSHLSLYSMRGERKRDYPANLFVQQPWWEDEKKFADYTGRLCVAVTQGKRDVDILVLHTIASFWSEYSPCHVSGDVAETYKLTLEHKRYDCPFEELSHELINHKLDFHYGDEMIMENHAKVENGKFIVGNHAYSTVVIPPMLTIRDSTLELLNEFISQAGEDSVICISEIPSRINGVTNKVDGLKDVIKLNSIEEAIDHLDAIYRDRIDIVDRKTGEKQNHILSQKRNTDDGVYYLLANTSENESSDIKIGLTSEKTPLILDLMSGDAFSIPYSRSNEKVIIECTLHAAGSILIYLPNEKMDKKAAPAYLHSGVSFPLNYCVTKTINGWKNTVLEENVLPINDLTLYVKGEKVLDSKKAAYAWHNIFEQLEEGTSFKAEYRFKVDEVPESDLIAVIEVAENLDKVTINGTAVKPMKDKGELGIFDPSKSWKDINFTKVPLQRMIKEGENILVIEGKKYNNITAPGCHRRVEDYKDFRPTEIEAVYIVGDFGVKNDSNRKFSIVAPKTVRESENICEDGYPFYAGSVSFSHMMEWTTGNEDVFLKLKDVNAATVKVYVNDDFVDLQYMAPYLFNITDYLKDGANKIEVMGTNTLFNLMGPNWIKGIEDVEFVTPRTFVAFDDFTEAYTLLPFGIGDAEVLEVSY